MDRVEDAARPPEVDPRAAEPPLPGPGAATPDHGGRARRGDRAITLLLVVQAVSLFVAIPAGASTTVGRVLLDGCHLAFTLVAAAMLVQHRALRWALVGGLLLLLATPLALRPNSHLVSSANAGGAALPVEAITAIAFLFNALITVVIARHVFGPGRVNAHRIQGAILVYLNVAALFSIAYGFVTSVDPAAITRADGGLLPAAMGARIAALTYFSLVTITTTGFGDLLPVHALARSLANAESVFGHLFPATMLARLVALNVSHGRKG